MSKKITFLLGISISISLIVSLVTFFLARQVLGLTFGGAPSMGGNKITSLGTPTSSGDAATKNYADSVDPGAKSAVRAYRNTTGQTIPSGTWQKILFNAENYDAAGNFNADGVNSNFTAPSAGYYFISATMRWSSYSGTGTYTLAIYKNGSRITRKYLYGYVISGTTTSVESLAAGDVIDIRIYSSGGTIIAGSHYTYISIYKLGS